MNTLDARRRLLGRNVYKKTTEGNPAIAQGSLARMYPGIAMQGWTEQNRYEGNQLFDKSTVVSNTYISDTNGLALPDSAGERSASDYINVEGMSSVFATKMVGSGSWMAFYDNDKIFISGNEGIGYGVPIAVPDNATYARFTVRNEYIESFMVNEGNALLPWEPYTGRQPSPSPDYKQDVKNAGKYDEETQKYEHGIELAGKNLLDEKSVAEVSNVSGITIEWLEDEKCFLLNGTCTRSGSFALTDINLKGNIGSNYTVSVHRISGDVSVPDGGACVAYFGVNDSPSSGGHPKENWIASHIENEVPSTGALNRKYINTFWFYITEGVSLVNCKLNVMLEQGNTATEYEPYKLPQTVTLTADRPLTKWDKLEKRNGQWGWVYKSNEIVLDGSEDEVWELYEESTTKLISFQIDLLGDTKGSQVSLCDKYINKYGAWYMDKYGIYSDHEITKYKYFRPPSAEVETVEQWTDWLAQNPLTVLYETAEETFTPLSESEQELMNALHTYRPTTVLTNDVDCNMTLTYKTKKSMGGGNPYGLEIGMINGSGGWDVSGYPNRIRTGYITFYSPDGDRTIHVIGYTPFVMLTAHAYGKDKKWIRQFPFSEGELPAGTNYVRYTFRKIDNSNFTSDELNNLIKTFDVERS